MKPAMKTIIQPDMLVFWATAFFFLVHPTFVWVTAAGYRLRPPQWK